MSWAVVFATLFAKGTNAKEKLFFPAIIILGVLPDVDLFLYRYGIEHHTFFHSIVFWIVLFLPALLIFRFKALPYLVAVLQHFVFGDFFVGKVMLFWPFSFDQYGFDNGMLSNFDIVLEVGGLVLAFLVLYYAGDLKRLVSVKFENFFMGIPLLALVSSMFYFAVDWPFAPLISFIWSSPMLTTIVVGHLILVGFFVVSSFQGLRRFVV